MVVQRYGAEVPGGAEGACRSYAEQLAARGHAIEVLTTTAKNYVDWAPYFAEGSEQLDGVTVHRFDVEKTRDEHFFSPLYVRTIFGHRPVPLYLQEEWMRTQGPYAPRLAHWIEEKAGEYDAVVFFTYLYWTTWAGLRAAAGKTVVVLHPLAHDEPPLRQPLFRLALNIPDALAFATEEEQRVVIEALGVSSPSRVVGIGIDLEKSGTAQSFRARYPEIGDRPFVLFLGRVDPGKGSDEVYDFFVEYKKRNPSDLALVIMGDPVKPLDPHPDVFVTGFVEEQTKFDALAACLLLIQPSYFESFSIVLCEAWIAGRAAMVQGHSEPLVGQARRSGGAIPYENYAEFEVALSTLVADPGLRDRMGEAGNRYVRDRYTWDRVLDRYEDFLERTIRRKGLPRPVGIPA